MEAQLLTHVFDYGRVFRVISMSSQLDPGDIWVPIHFKWGFLHSSFSKESACNAGDPSLIPGLGGFSGEGNGNPLQYSCLENPMDRGAWQAPVHGVARVGLSVRVSD